MAACAIGAFHSEFKLIYLLQDRHRPRRKRVLFEIRWMGKMNYNLGSNAAKQRDDRGGRVYVLVACKTTVLETQASAASYRVGPKRAVNPL